MADQWDDPVYDSIDDFNFGTEWWPTPVYCTGVSATWCPVHGDCACPDIEEARCDENCPLHNSRSTHADEIELEEW